MRWFALLAVAVLLAGCSGAGNGKADQATGPAAPGPGVLDGVVVDDAIRPLGGARVDLDGAANVTTADDGRFHFEGVATGAHVIRATKNGFADAVTQVIQPAEGQLPSVKLVLVVDTTNLAYASLQKIDGFVQCGTDTFNSHFAACGGPNVGSFILCAQTGVCQGNLTEDDYIVIQRFDRTPTFLAVETAWTPTQDLGKSLSIWLGSATKEQLQFFPETPSVWNVTEGPSPLYGSMNSTMLVDSGIGKDSWFLAQVFAGDSGITQGITGIGVVFQQPFQMFLTSFYGYAPPGDWRFATMGAPPPPPLH